MVTLRLTLKTPIEPLNIWYEFCTLVSFPALFYAAGVLGPAIGYIVGGYMLTIHTDFNQLDPDKYSLVIITTLRV